MNSIVSQHIISRHPASGKPKIVETRYSNGHVIRMHYHNDGHQVDYQFYLDIWQKKFIAF